MTLDIFRIRSGSPYRGKVFAYFPSVLTIRGKVIPNTWAHPDCVTILTADRYTPIRIVPRKDLLDSVATPDSPDVFETDILSSKQDSSYHVIRQGDIWTCECVGFTYHKTCRHIADAKQIEEWENEDSRSG